MTNLISSIKENEGFVDHVYKDHLGFDTIGYGFKVDALKRDELAINGNRLEPMSEEVADKILELKLKKLRIELLKKLSWISSLELSLQEALLEMAYQLGVPKMLGFKNTLECIRLGDFTQAIINLRASLWYRQTPKRVLNLISALEV